MYIIMTKTTKVVTGIVVILLLVWLLNPGVKNVQEKIIKIGIVAPLTGPGAVFGTSLVNTLEIARSRLIGTKNTYEFIIEDDGTDPGKSASAASKLLNVNHVDALMGITSGTGNSIAPLAESAKVPTFCICADSKVGRGEYVFNNFVLPSDDASAWLEEAKTRGVKSIVLLSQNHPGINAIVDEVEKQAPAFGISILFKERFVPTQRDFKTDITKARSMNPDLYFVMSFPPSVDIIGTELKNMEIDNISTVTSFGIAADPSIYEGRWYVDTTVNDQSLIDVFHKSYPTVRFNVTSASGYDSFGILVKGFESGLPMNQYLRNLSQFEGISGVNIKDPGTHFFHTDPSLWIIKGGKPQFVKVLTN